jgi:hypothetical protein
MTAPWTGETRETVLVRYRREVARYNQAMDEHAEQLNTPGEIGIDESSSAYVDTPAYRLARASLAEIEAAEEEYFRRLPRAVMAPCPHCDKPLYRSFDALGLDGLWWRSDATPEEPQPCPHFCVLLGAVNLGEHRPLPGFDVHPGPGAPFVMPRLLAHPGMVAVLAAIPMVDGAVAYPVAYFAPRRPPIQSLTAPWARTNFVYTTQLGEHAWRRADEPTGAPGDDTWDFELGRWADSGQLRWCDPGSDRTSLSSAAPSECPFVGLPGSRAFQVIRTTSALEPT